MAARTPRCRSANFVSTPGALISRRYRPEPRWSSSQRRPRPVARIRRRSSSARCGWAITQHRTAGMRSVESQDLIEPPYRRASPPGAPMPGRRRTRPHGSGSRLRPMWRPPIALPRQGVSAVVAAAGVEARRPSRGPLRGRRRSRRLWGRAVGCRSPRRAASWRRRAAASRRPTAAGPWQQCPPAWSTRALMAARPSRRARYSSMVIVWSRENVPVGLSTKPIAFTYGSITWTFCSGVTMSSCSPSLANSSSA